MTFMPITTSTPIFVDPLAEITIDITIGAMSLQIKSLRRLGLLVGAIGWAAV